MDAPRQRHKVGVEGAGEDAGVRSARVVEQDEVTSVECYQNPLLFGCECWHGFIRQGLVCTARFLDS